MLRILCCLLFVAAASAESLPCKSRTISSGKIVCVCDANYCDTLESPELPAQGDYIVYTSNKEGLRFEKSGGSFENFSTAAANVKIDVSKTYQTIEGFGGAFTDATGINVKALSEAAGENLLKAYFSSGGIEYSLCRVPIGGTDFSTRGYSYDDGDEDPELKNFNLTSEDFDYKIPLIKKAIELTQNNIEFLASAWTAPKWMKTNNEYSGFLGFLKEEHYQTWVDYFIKFFDAYNALGINFWGLTTGNEPSLALTFSKINSIAWTPSMQQKWIGQNLGPTIKNSPYANLKIMALDDQLFFLPWFIELLFQDEVTENYVDGIAVHWYWDKMLPATLLTATHDKFPQKFLIATEASVGDKPWEKQTDLGSWSRGEDYATDIIRDLTHYFIGWLDWNMALDLNGGPTYIGNSVDSAIVVNATADEFYKQPMFYALGHFSKFIPKGSVRVDGVASYYNDNVQVFAVKRPDDAIAVVILNKNFYRATLVIEDKRRGRIPLTVSKHSITTIIYK